MMGFNAFRNVDKSIYENIGSGGKISLGAHNSLLQLANTSSFSSPAMYGAGLGAAYGALDGAFSYDGSMVGGAFHGAMLGAVGGVGAKFAADTYGRGALSSGFATGKAGGAGARGTLKSAWSDGGAAFKNSEGQNLGAFQWSAFSKGW